MKKKIKIAFFIPALGRVKRGVETNVWALAERLADDFQVTVFYAGGQPPATKGVVLVRSWAVLQDSFLIQWLYHHLGLIRRLSGRWFAYWPAELENLTFCLSILPLMLKETYVVVFPVSIWGIIICRIIRAIKGTKIVHINHGGTEDFIARQKPNLFVALTPDVLRWLKKNHPSVPSVLIPFGVDFHLFLPAVKPAKLFLEKPIFICVAALTEYKNIDLTIRAVAGLKKSSLVVLGEGEEKEKLSRLGQGLLGEKRFLLKVVPHRLVPRFLAAAEVFTMVSENDSFPVAYLEAMAMNLPVVAPDDERRRFMIGRAGIFCHPDNLEDYRRVLTAAAKKDFRDRPRRQAEKFSLEKTVTAYRRVIKKMAGV